MTTSAFPDFQDPATFLTFATAPDADSLEDAPAANTAAKTYLAATISQNMTLSTTPTFICIDSSAASFALTIILSSPLTPAQLEGSTPVAENGSEFDIKKMKKGHTVIIPDPKRHGVKAGKQGYVRCRWSDLLIVPTSLDKILSMSGKYSKARDELGESEDSMVKCQACGKSGKEEEFSRCKGCSVVWYCGKECQTEGWNEKGHKSECKVLKVVSKIEV